MLCDITKNTIFGLDAKYNSENKMYTITYYHKSACGEMIFSFFNNVGNWVYVYTTIIPLLSLFMLFAGIRFNKITLPIEGIFFGADISLFLLNIYNPTNHPNWWMYVNIAVVVVVSFTSGYLFLINPKIAKIGNGMIIGSIFAYILYNSVIYLLETSQDFPIGLYV